MSDRLQLYSNTDLLKRSKRCDRKIRRLNAEKSETRQYAADPDKIQTNL